MNFDPNDLLLVAEEYAWACGDTEVPGKEGADELSPEHTAAWKRVVDAIDLEADYDDTEHGDMLSHLQTRKEIDEFRAGNGKMMCYPDSHPEGKMMTHEEFMREHPVKTEPQEAREVRSPDPVVIEKQTSFPVPAYA